MCWCVHVRTQSVMVMREAKSAECPPPSAERAARSATRPRPRMYGNPSDVCILAGSGGDHLTEEVCGLLGVPSTSCTHTKSDGGELKIAINENIRGRDAHIIQSTCHPVNDNIIELSLIVSALRRASAERVIAVVPYYGYGRQTRKLRSREPISAADVATIFEDQGLDQIITVDLQHGQIAGFFSPRCSLDNLSVIPAVARVRVRVRARARVRAGKRLQ